MRHKIEEKFLETRIRHLEKYLANEWIFFEKNDTIIKPPDLGKTLIPIKEKFRLDLNVL